MAENEKKLTIDGLDTFINDNIPTIVAGYQDPGFMEKISNDLKMAIIQWGSDISKCQSRDEMLVVFSDLMKKKLEDFSTLSDDEFMQNLRIVGMCILLYTEPGLLEKLFNI